MNPTIRPIDPKRLRRLSRAAVVLNRAAHVAVQGALAAERICAALQAELRAPVRCTGQVLEAAARPLQLCEGSCYLAFSLGADARHALVELETGFAAALIDRLTGGSGAAFAPEQPSSAEVAALSYLALHAVRAAREESGVQSELAPRFAAVARDAGEASGLLSRERTWVVVELSLAVGDCRGGGRLLLPAATTDRLARLGTSPSPRPPLPIEVGKATLGARLYCGHAGLEESELEGLCPGDAIVLGGLARAPGGLAGNATLQFDGFHLHGALNGRAFSLASISDALPTEAFMHDCPTQVSTLPIDLQVEIARLKVPLSQLDQIKPGSVIELESTLTDPVVLRVGDRAVAKAELVDIDGELAARVLALLP